MVCAWWMSACDVDLKAAYPNFVLPFLPSAKTKTMDRSRKSAPWSGHRTNHCDLTGDDHVAYETATLVGPVIPYQAVVISLVRLSYARHMRAYVICGGLICGAYAAYGRAG